MESFMMSLTIEQLQTNFDQAIDFVKTSKPLTITQDGQPMTMLLSFKEGSELLRLRHVVRLEGYFCYAVKESPTGCVRAVCGRQE
jgi:hypothetical protein